MRTAWRGRKLGGSYSRTLGLRPLAWDLMVDGQWIYFARSPGWYGLSPRGSPGALQDWKPSPYQASSNSPFAKNSSGTRGLGKTKISCSNVMFFTKRNRPNGKAELKVQRCSEIAPLLVILFRS